MPKSAVRSNNLNRNVRHSLKTELLSNIETNCGNLGLVTNSEDVIFRSLIRRFQEPTEIYLPMTFTTCYKTSLYTRCPNMIEPAVMWDSTPNTRSKQCAAVEFKFLIQTLTTAWIKKYDSLHEFTKQTPIGSLIRTNENVRVKHGTSETAKLIRGEEADCKDDVWTGRRTFQESRLEMGGLRIRRNAENESQ